MGNTRPVGTAPDMGAYNEDLVLNSDKRISLDGGWDTTFTTRTSPSIVKPLGILKGIISCRDLVIQ